MERGPVDPGGVAVTDAFDLDAGARVIGKEVDAYDPETLDDVRFIACGDEYETVRRVSDEVREG